MLHDVIWSMEDNRNVFKILWSHNWAKWLFIIFGISFFFTFFEIKLDIRKKWNKKQFKTLSGKLKKDRDDKKTIYHCSEYSDMKNENGISLFFEQENVTKAITPLFFELKCFCNDSVPVTNYSIVSGEVTFPFICDFQCSKDKSLNKFCNSHISHLEGTKLKAIKELVRNGNGKMILVYADKRQEEVDLPSQQIEQMEEMINVHSYAEGGF